MAKNQSKRVQAEAELLRVLEQMIQESGNAEGFDARAWLKRWLSLPHPALNGATPKSYLGDDEGRRVVNGLLVKMQSGAYA